MPTKSGNLNALNCCSVIHRLFCILIEEKMRMFTCSNCKDWGKKRQCLCVLLIVQTKGSLEDSHTSRYPRQRGYSGVLSLKWLYPSLSLSYPSHCCCPSPNESRAALKSLKVTTVSLYVITHVIGYWFPNFSCCVMIIITSECSGVIDHRLTSGSDGESLCDLAPVSRSGSSEYRPPGSGTLQVAFKVRPGGRMW